MGQEATEQEEADVPQEHRTYPNHLKMFEEEQAFQKMSQPDFHVSRDTQSWVCHLIDNYPHSFFAVVGSFYLLPWLSGAKRGCSI